MLNRVDAGGRQRSKTHRSIVALPSGKLLCLPFKIRFSGKFPDGLKSFRWPGKFPDGLESLQMVPKVSRWPQKFLDCLEISG